MMVLLRKLADKGHTIILVTHATNNINVCDYVCFLAKGGRLAYFGPPEEAKAYFGKTDFAEIYSILSATEENPNIPAEAEARFKESADYQTYIAAPLKEHATFNASRPLPAKTIKRSRPGKLIKQLGILAQRNMELLRNNRAALFLLLAQAPIIALALMLLIRFEIGGGVFEPNNVVLCQSQIITAAGPVGIAAKTGSVSCDQIVTFLKTDPNGIQYERANGGVNAALQNFIIQGQGINPQRTLFLIAFVAVLIGMLNAIREIVKEGVIYRRERTVNLGILPYMLSKVMVFSLLALVQMACVVVIVDLVKPLRQGIFLPVLLETYITLALAGIGGVLLGFVVSAWSVNEDMAASLLAVAIVPQVIFSGVIVPLKDVVTQSIAMIFPLRWAMSGLGSSLGLHSDLIGGDRLFGDSYLYHPTLFSTYSQEDATQHLVLCWIAMGVLCLMMILLVGLALKQKDARR